MKTTNTEKVVHLENKSGHIFFRPTAKPDRTGDYDITITTKQYKVLVSGTIARARGKALYQLCKDSDKPYMDLFTDTDTALIMKEAAKTEATESQMPMHKQECKQDVDCYDGFSQSTKVTMQDLEDEIKKYRNLWRQEQEKNAKLEKLCKTQQEQLDKYSSAISEHNNLLIKLWTRLLEAADMLGAYEFLATILARRDAVADSSTDSTWYGAEIEELLLKSSLMTRLCYGDSDGYFLYSIIEDHLAEKQIEIPQLPCGTKCFACTKLNCLECSEYKKNNTGKEVK